MKRTLILTAVLTLGAGCSGSGASMITIGGRAAPDSVPSCKFAPGGQLLLGPGTLDVGAFPSGLPNYQLVVYLTNNLADPTALAPDSTKAAKTWYGYAARVRVNPTDYTGPYQPNPALLNFHMENTVPLDGQPTAAVGGQSTQHLEAISGPLGAQLAMNVPDATPRRIVLGITLEGATADGASLDTGEWFFPVDLCNGCLAPATATCPTGQVLAPTSCFGVGQDSAPTCQQSQ